MRTMLKSKIHRATVTQSNLNYVGSITIDQSIAEAADLVPHEQVEVTNINNGARYITYALYGPAGSGIIGINGASARLAHLGDTIIIVSYALVDESVVKEHTPAVVFVDSANQIVETGDDPASAPEGSRLSRGDILA